TACAVVFAVEHAPRDASHATRRGRLTDMCHAVDAVQITVRPEGDLRDGSQCEKEAQLEVEGELGRESHQGRVRDGTQEELERGRVGGDLEDLCQRADHRLDRLVEAGAFEGNSCERVRSKGETGRPLCLFASAGRVDQRAGPRSGGCKGRSSLRSAVEARKGRLELVDEVAAKQGGGGRYEVPLCPPFV